MYIIGKKSDLSIAYASGVLGPGSPDPALNRILIKTVTRLGGVLNATYNGIFRSVNSYSQENDTVTLAVIGTVASTDPLLSLSSDSWSVFFTPNSSDPTSPAQLILNGATYTLVWTAGEITGLDFTPENTKRWVHCELDKTEILADGVDTAVLTVSILKADKSGVATTVNGTQNVSVVLPSGQYAEVKVTVTNGIGTKNIKSTIPGLIRFPASTKYLGVANNFKVDNIVTINALVNW